MSVLAGCSDDPATPVVDVDLNGQWNFEQIVANQTEAVACVLRGTVWVEQTHDRWRGDLNLDESECIYLIDGGAPDGPEFGNAPIDFGSGLSDGGITGRAVTGRSTLCSYAGELIGDPAIRLAGDVTCTLSIPGEYDGVPVAGSWSAVR